MIKAVVFDMDGALVLHSTEPLEHRWVVHDPQALLQVVKELIAESGGPAF